MMVTLADLFSVLLPGFSINQLFVNWFTVGIFFLSISLSFLIIVVDNASMEEHEFERLRQEPIESLEKEFDKLNGDS
jgi:hypothetical protein